MPNNIAINGKMYDYDAGVIKDREGRVEMQFYNDHQLIHGTFTKCPNSCRRPIDEQRKVIGAFGASWDEWKTHYYQKGEQQ